MLFGDHIPLEAAARKWTAGRQGVALQSAERMRFYCLTQYLHWLHCSFEPAGRNKTSRTLVNVFSLKCVGCGCTIVSERHRDVCSVKCAAKRLKPNPNLRQYHADA
jgi:hypothetical protein